MTRQLSLLEPPTQDEVASDRPMHEALDGVTWSYSRRTTLEQCVRRYYYEYFGANKRIAKQEADKETLHLLKQLQTRHERTGSILHLVIGTYLSKVQKGDLWSVDRLVAWARDMFHKDIAYSQSYPDGGDLTKERFPPALLREFHYRDPEAREQCAEAEDRLVRALAVFATDQRYQLFRAGGSQPGALIEQPFKLRGTLPCRIEGRIDLAYSSDGKATIADWKLGVEDGTGDDSLQLAAYALWAVDHYHFIPQSLRICKIHLGSGTIIDFKADQSLLESARARIVQDAEQMLILNDYGQRAISEAFTPCQQPAVCRLCSFQKACPEGKETVRA